MDEIKISKNELRKMSSEFRMYGNRLLQALPDNGISNLKRFLNFIDNNVIISSFIKSNSHKEFEMSSICKYNSFGYGLKIPDESPADEICFIYQLLKYGLQNFYNNELGYWELAMVVVTVSGGKRKDIVDNFNQNVLKPFILHIENYLTRLQIDLGEDENSKLTIHIYGDNYGNNTGVTMTETNINQNNSSLGVGVNQGEINADKIAGTINEAEKRNIAETAAEIQQLLEQLDKSYQNNNTTTGKMAVAMEAIKQIENNPRLMARIHSALKAGTTQALAQFLNHPAASFVIGAFEDWQKSNTRN